ncbi:MAG: hypothetical protein Kow006_29980 [Gammaproteobacteria bacterium]
MAKQRLGIPLLAALLALALHPANARDKEPDFEEICEVAGYEIVYDFRDGKTYCCPRDATPDETRSRCIAKESRNGRRPSLRALPAPRREFRR